VRRAHLQLLDGGARLAEVTSCGGRTDLRFWLRNNLQQAAASGPLFRYTEPSIQRTDPTSAASIGGVPLSIIGKKYAPRACCAATFDGSVFMLYVCYRCSFGKNSGAALVVTVGGASCPIVSQDHTQVVCTLPAGQGSARPVLVTVRVTKILALCFAVHSLPAGTERFLFWCS